ncbi:MAG: hypothetical protein LBS57_00510 [Treponema sp.]|jgi:hypothetical protein|nr:hypothetical protein [Treponema sp.]
MSISSASTIEEKREEAVKLVLSFFQFPVTALDGADLAAAHVIQGAETLLDYVESGKIKPLPARS